MEIIILLLVLGGAVAFYVIKSKNKKKVNVRVKAVKKSPAILTK